MPPVRSFGCGNTALPGFTEFLMFSTAASLGLLVTKAKKNSLVPLS